MEVAHELGAEGYIFWGGREGYSTLWNTDMKRELEHLAKFLHMAVATKTDRNVRKLSRNWRFSFWRRSWARRGIHFQGQLTSSVFFAR
jgi:hypothetical protein